MITYTAQELFEKILDLREDGYKRKAVDLIIQNKIDGSDLFFALRKRGDWDEAGLVGIITLMDSAMDQMRDEAIIAKRKETK